MTGGKNYVVFTMVSMVVGTVIGSGVFFKTGTMLTIADSGLEVLLAWIIGGAGMMLCLLSFVCAVRACGGENRLSSIAEKTMGKGFACFLSLFMAAIYYPAMACVLAWLTSVYTLISFGMYSSSGWMCMVLSFAILIFSFFQNFFFSGASKKIQVITTMVKMLPLVLMIILGIIKGREKGILNENLRGASYDGDIVGSFCDLIGSVLFAYEGWIASLSVGSGTEKSKRSFPAALIMGGTTVVFVYVFYSIGLMSVVGEEVFLNYGNEGVKIAFSEILGNRAASLLTAFVAISCVGALNGMMLGMKTTIREMNPKNEDSFLKWLTLLVLWLSFFIGTSVTENSFFNGFKFDVSEIPVVTLYAMYIPIFIKTLKNKGLGRMRCVVAGGVSFCATVVLVVAFARFEEILRYLPVFASVMLFGIANRKKQS